MRADNSFLEKYYFEQFRKHYPLPPAEVIYGDKPDVVLVSEKRIGVEIARLYLTDGRDSSSEQRQADLRSTVLGLAQARYIANGGRGIELTAAFDPQNPIRDVTAIAKSLAGIAHEVEAGPGGEVRKDLFASLPEVNFLYYNPKEYADPKWRIAQVYTTPALAVQRLREIVAAKQTKAANYQQCDSLWLLLIVDMADRAQDQDIGWPMDGDPILSHFERIIIYKPQYAAWTEVPNGQRRLGSKC